MDDAAKKAELDAIYRDLEAEVSAIIDGWWKKIKWNVEHPGSPANPSSSAPTANRSLPWFKHGVKGFLNKLWYGDHPNNPTWGSLPRENVRRRLTLSEYHSVQNTVEVFFEDATAELIANTKSDLLSSIVKVIANHLNRAYSLGLRHSSISAPASAPETPKTEPVSTPEPEPESKPEIPAPAEEMPDIPNDDEIPSEPSEVPTPSIGREPEPEPEAPITPNSEKRGRGRRPLSPEEKEQRLRAKEQAKAQAKAERRANKEFQITSEFVKEVEQRLPYLAAIPRLTEDKKIDHRTTIYNQLGLQHDKGTLKYRPGYERAIGEIVYHLIKEGDWRPTDYNNTRKYERVFGKMDGIFLDRTFLYVEKKLEEGDNETTNADFSNIEAPATESYKSKFLKMICEKQKNSAILESRKLPMLKKVQFLKEAFKLEA